MAQQQHTLGAMILGAAMYGIINDKLKTEPRRKIEQQVTYCLLLDEYIQDEQLTETVLQNDYFETKVELEDAKADLIDMVIKYF